MTTVSRLERQIAIALYRDEFDCSEETAAEHFQWYDDGKSNPDSCVHSSNVSLMLRRARIAAAIFQPAWLPIDKAPTDGTRILLAWADSVILPTHVELGWALPLSARVFVDNHGHPFTSEPAFFMHLPSPQKARGDFP